MAEKFMDPTPLEAGDTMAEKSMDSTPLEAEDTMAEKSMDSTPLEAKDTMAEKSMDPSPSKVEAEGVKLGPWCDVSSPAVTFEVDRGAALNSEEPLVAFTQVEGVHHGEEVDRRESSTTQLLNRSVEPLVTTSTTTNSITLNWSDNFLFHSIPNNTKVKIEIKICTSFAWTMVYYGSATSHSVTGLPADTKVGVRLRATNPDWSWEAVYSTLPGPPDAPLMAKALRIGRKEVQLVWRPPVHDGGASITGFCVEMEMRASAWREVGTSTGFAKLGSGSDTSFVAKELEPGSTYCFRVQACTKLGAGPYSRLVVVETLPAPPATPEPPVVVEQASKCISLRWLSPPCNGASVDSFKLQMLVLGYSLRASFRPSELYDDLQPATLRNGADQSLVHTDRSNSSLSKGTSSEGDCVNDGADGAESRTVSNIYSGPSQEFEVKKLRPFSSYAFRVQAQNAVGSSEFSAYLVCMTAAGSPCPPPPPTVIDTKSTSLTLKWEVPERDNGYPVVGYTLEMQELGLSNAEHMNATAKKMGKSKKGSNLYQDHAVVQSASTTGVWVVVYEGQELLFQITGLAPCHEYRFRVKAQNRVGTSSPSSALVAKSLPAAPGAPQPPTFYNVTSTSVQIKWSPPANDNGMPVTSFELLFDDGQGGQIRKVYEGEARSFWVSNLLPSSSYRAAVQAVNARGASDMSEVAVVETLPVPQAPRIASPIDDLSCKERPLPADPAPKLQRPVAAVPVLFPPPRSERLVPAPVLVPIAKKERRVRAGPALVPPPKTESRREPAPPVVVPLLKTEGRRRLVVTAPDSTAKVVASASKTERPVLATVAAAERKTKRPTKVPTDHINIKSKKEVKELVRKAHQPWFQKVANFIWRNVRQIQPLWVLWILFLALLSFIFGFLLALV